MNLIKAWWCLRTLLTRWSYISVGRHSYIGKPIFIQRKGIRIGNNVRIYPGMRAELTCKDAVIDFCDNISVGQNLHIVCYKGNLQIGKNTTISGNVFISNVDHCYSDIGIHILEQELVYKETLIGENCFIGYGAVILPGTKLGKQCIIGSNSVVKGEYPDYCVIAGAPAKIIKKYNPMSRKWERYNG